MNEISVLIITRNRANVLRDCLLSLKKQTEFPKEIIIIDNDSVDKTKQIVQKFKNQIEISVCYFKEKKIGIPFARNLSLKKAKGETFAFLDDDCIADKDWIKNIRKHFENFPQSVGVLGRSFNYHETNPWASVEQFYFERWLLSEYKRLDKKRKILDGKAIDFKNAAFAKRVFEKIDFKTDVPFGEVGDEDVEIGVRIFARFNSIFYDPKIKVYHKNSSNIKRLIKRNFLNGVANRQLLQKNKIDIKKTPYSVNFQELVFLYKRRLKNLKVIDKLLFTLALVLYPLVSKTGSLVSLISEKLGRPYFIPWR